MEINILISIGCLHVIHSLSETVQYLDAIHGKGCPTFVHQISAHFFLVLSVSHKRVNALREAFRTFDRGTQNSVQKLDSSWRNPVRGKINHGE